MDPLQIVAEPSRREILRLVWDDELTAGEIAGRFAVTFGAVSHHLAVLRDAGYVRVRRDGNRRYYRADKGRLGPLAPTLVAMWSSTLDTLADTVEDEAGQ
jgi:DNA-binding transcriptional ArsR family regulator